MATNPGMQFNNPQGLNGQPKKPATIDGDGTKSRQLAPEFWYKKALIDEAKAIIFGKLADTISMPKHFGKSIVRYQYIPVLDDRNVNDQGLNANGAYIAHGNLYGSSRDIGKINANLPTLTEDGGRKNRIGFTRITREGSLFQLGFFYEWTRESLEMDSDADLLKHCARECMRAAIQISEALLQRDLLDNAGVRIFPGTATRKTEVTGEGTAPTVIDYNSLMKLDQILTENRSEKKITYISGSRMVDTRTIPSSRIMYISSAVTPLLRNMRDSLGNAAFIPVEKYAAAGKIMEYEIGSVGSFRFIEVPEMLYWAGKGATVTNNKDNYRTTNNKYDVFPCLTVGSDSFNTIGFASGKDSKYQTITKYPGEAMAGIEDPYGLKGFSSIRWYYGFLCNRPEWIGIIFTVAPV